MSTHPPAKILLVDDQPGKLLTYRTILEGLGQTLISASTAQEALAVLVKTDVAVILMDVCLPDIDGFELATMVRQHPRHEKTAIIFVSGIRLSQDDLVRGYKIGAVDYVPVPVEAEILKAKVKIFVELHHKTKLLREVNEELEARVLERTSQLEAANERLRHSEERLTLAAEAARFASYEFEIASGKFRWSHNAANLLAVSPDRLHSLRDILEAAHADDQEKILKRFTDVHVEPRPLEIEFRTGDEQLGFAWLVDRGKVVRGSGGKPERILGTFLDITQRKQAEEHQHLLMAELDHRVKNVLANVSALARLSSTGVTSVNHYVTALQGRIQSMSAAHDLLRQCEWRGADFHELVDVTLEPFSLDASNIIVEGEKLMLPARTAQSLALVLHELTTNAVKHGALSTSRGRVAIGWKKLAADERLSRFVLTWKEIDGPTVVKPKRRGFGLSVLHSAAAELDGKAQLDFKPSGFEFTFERPLHPIAVETFRVKRPEVRLRDPEAAASTRRVLVVEDEILVGMQLSNDLQSDGHYVIGPASTLEQGLQLVQDGGFDCALIDVRLGKDMSGAIADRLRAQNIPFALTTGFDDLHQLDRAFGDAPRLKKPYEATAVREMVRQLCEHRTLSRR